MIDSLAYVDGKLEHSLSEGRIAELLKNKDAVLWLDFENAIDSEYGLLSKLFNFHPLTIEDCQHT